MQKDSRGRGRSSRLFVLSFVSYLFRLVVLTISYCFPFLYTSQDLKSAHASVTSTRSLLSQRESDLDSLQAALNSLESSTRRHGETTSSERVALELETERVKRDLQRVERELEAVTRELDERERASREAALKLATTVRSRSALSFPSLPTGQRLIENFDNFVAIREQGPRLSTRRSDSAAPYSR
jgi:septal ring factor EnvC (AmiA/AmiB activator)